VIPNSLLQEVAFSSFMIFIGIVLFYATFQRWRLVDPPESWWWFSSQALVKKHFGSKAAIRLSYFVAGGFIVVGAIALSTGLITLCGKMGYC